MRIAVLFPGQGSQLQGMADPWLEHPAGREAIADASDVLGYDVAEACRDEKQLGDTAVVQPVLFACDLAALRVLEAEGLELQMVAGHSLGEFVALVAAGFTEMRPTLEVVVERGRAMQDAAEQNPGAMTALVGISPDEAAEIVQTAGRGDVLTVANENSPKQTVVSGSVAAIERAEEMVRSRSAKAVRLNVAGAFHSPLMQSAAPRVRRAISQLAFTEPRVPVVSNVSGRPVVHPSAMRDLLGRHVVSPVRWGRSMRSMVEAGIDTFIEAGPGDVLTKLAKRTARDARTFSIDDPSQAADLPQGVMTR